MSSPLVFQIKEQPWRANGSPDFAPPEVVGYYSLDEQRKFSSDLSQLKYCQPPRSRKEELDLKTFEVPRRMSYRATTEKLDRLLEWISKNSSQIRVEASEDRWIAPHFVCYRGLLKQLWCTPFNKNEEWIIHAYKYKGTIYLCAGTEDKEPDEANSTVKKNPIDANLASRTSPWAPKVDRYIVSESPDQEPNIQEPVNKGEFNCVFRSRLGDNILLYGAQIDAVSSEKELKDSANWNEQNFVKLKTSKKIETEKDAQIFRYKYLKWWCESLLVGIKYVLCAFVDTEGVLRELRSIPVADMLKLSEKPWSPAEMAHFCDEFLDWVRSRVVKDYKETVYKFQYHHVRDGSPHYPNGRILLEELNGDPKFLPRWFTEEAERSNAE